MKLIRYNDIGWIAWWCPGCNDSHSIPIKPTEKGWDFSGTDEKPTLSPSVLCYEHKKYDDNMNVVTAPKCHCFVRDGKIQFLGDSTHSLAGQTVDLPDWPKPIKEES